MNPRAAGRGYTHAWTVAAVCAIPSLIVLLEPALEELRVIRPGRLNAPAVMWTWLATLAVSLGLAVWAMCVRPAEANGARPRRWIALPAALAIVYVAVAAFQFEEGHDATGWMAAGLGLLAGAGAMLTHWGRDTAAKRLLAVTGFIALPIGVLLVLISREIAALAWEEPIRLPEGAGSLGLK